MHLRLRRRYARHRHDVEGRATRHSRRRADRTDSRRARAAISNASSSRTTTSTRRTPKRIAVSAKAIYTRLSEGGYIFTRDVEQLFDPDRKLFLADRFVKGECPRCGSDDQYGDNCEVCGATYDATDLKNPRSLISGATPVLASSTHYFFDLPQFSDMLKQWVFSGTLQPEVSNKLAEWLDAGLKPWDISRDAPYFGFLIPGTTDKYFYVWMDAPIGYMASFRNYCRFTQRSHVRRVLAPRREHRGASLHRQGHRQLPRAVLAGGAAGFGLSQTDAGSHARLHYGGRHQNVEVARHLHQCRHVSEPPESGISALLLRDEVERHGRRHRHHVRRFRAAGEFRPRRQDRQHRQSLRRVHQSIERRRTRRNDPRSRNCGARSPTRRPPSRRGTNPASTARPCARSPRSPTAPISTLRSKRRGRSQKRKAAPPTCRRSAHSASTSSKCSSSIWHRCCPIRRSAARAS